MFMARNVHVHPEVVHVQTCLKILPVPTPRDAAAVEVGWGTKPTNWTLLVDGNQKSGFQSPVEVGSEESSFLEGFLSNL